MLTLADIAQIPKLTPQQIAALHLFGRAAGGLDQVSASEFESRFPDDFECVDALDQRHIPSARAYQIARKAVIRILAAAGHVKDPWEHLRVLIRQAGRRQDIEHCWGGLKTPALQAGLAPREVTTGWVWNLEAEAAGGFKRQRLRRAVVMFNALFDIEEIVASGLLPPCRIGPAPVYDIRGNIETPLPSALARMSELAPEQNRSAVRRVWCVIRDRELTSLEDPDADDLLALEPQIAAIAAQDVGHSDGTWMQYRQRFVATLRPYSTRQDTDRLPASLAALQVETPDEASAIKALWDQMRFSGIDQADTMAPAEILALQTWRAIWTPTRPDLSENSEKTFRNTSRRILLREASETPDPAQLVSQAWADLPREIKVVLAPIRKPATRAMLRPVDIKPAWVKDRALSDEEYTAIIRMIPDLERTIALCREAARPDPANAAWVSLRKEAKARGVRTIGLGRVETRAISDARTPDQLDLCWARKKAEGMPSRDRAKFAQALRIFDGMREDNELARRLPGQPISRLEDQRRRKPSSH
ncbi:hypothetical protein [Antarctobacter jejuensis]|uniref:hypothetical protein n=1 Tax=Antarctobacter jejuensis TaxID=1439938 RepID=UPI003FD630A0